jgi:tetratricopeptide (TPR) repeat protein
MQSAVVDTKTHLQLASQFNASGIVEYNNLNYVNANEKFRFAIAALINAGVEIREKHKDNLNTYRSNLSGSLCAYANTLLDKKEFSLAIDFYQLAINELKNILPDLHSEKRPWFYKFELSRYLNQFGTALLGKQEFENSANVFFEALEIINKILFEKDRHFKISVNDINNIESVRTLAESNLFSSLLKLKEYLQINADAKLKNPKAFISMLEDIKKLYPKPWKENQLEVLKINIIGCRKTYKPLLLFSDKPDKSSEQLPSFHPRFGSYS